MYIFVKIYISRSFNKELIVLKDIRIYMPKSKIFFKAITLCCMDFYLEKKYLKNIWNSSHLFSVCVYGCFDYMYVHVHTHECLVPMKASRGNQIP